VSVYKASLVGRNNIQDDLRVLGRANRYEKPASPSLSRQTARRPVSVPIWHGLKVSHQMRGAD
jgi:hypothetical protein